MHFYYSYIDERGIMHQEYCQPPLLPSHSFHRVVITETSKTRINLFDEQSDVHLPS